MAHGPYINNPIHQGGMAAEAEQRKSNQVLGSLARELEIPARMGDLNHEIDVLGEKLAALNQRLTPICNMQNASVDDRPASSKEPSTALGGQIAACAMQIRVMSGIVNEILTRVEV